MKVFYNQSYDVSASIEAELTSLNLQDSIQKTRQALDVAYAGFDNATDEDMIDCYIYEINALLKRYKHLSDLAAREPAPALQQASLSPVKALVSHVFG